MVTLLQLINHIGNSRRFKDGDFSVEDKSRSGQPKKFKDKELESITRRRSESNARGVAESLRVTQQAVSV